MLQLLNDLGEVLFCYFYVHVIQEPSTSTEDFGTRFMYHLNEFYTAGSTFFLFYFRSYM